MDFSDYYGNIVSRIYVDSCAKNLESVRRAILRLPGIPVHHIDGKALIPPEHRDRKTLFITGSRGNAVGKCPGTTGHVCCNYITMDAYMGCTLGCTYCVMKYYLNFSPVSVYADTKPGIEAVRTIARNNPDRMIRVGTGEVGDSLQFDPLFELSAEYIAAFSGIPNIQLELKTKTDFVDHLLPLSGKGNSVLGFSVNPESVISSEETGAAPLDRRIAAAKKAVKSGFMVAFHFDPIFLIKDWKEAYLSVVEKLSVIPEEAVAWISLGTFRYPPMLKEKIDDRPYLYEEFVPCRDGKFRYLQKVRSEMYGFIAGELSSRMSVPVYLCMESAEVWKNVIGGDPRKMERLRGIFAPVRAVPKHRPAND